MEESVNIAIAIADKRAEIIHHHQNGDAHLARRAEQELNTLVAQAETIVAASPIHGHHLRAMASASGDAGSAARAAAASDLDSQREKEAQQADEAHRTALAHALMLDDSAARATMLTGFAGEFADFRQWPLFQMAVTQALVSANGVPDKERAMQLKIALAEEIINKMPKNPNNMPGFEVRHFLNNYVQTELPSAKRDPQYMGMLILIQGTLQGWDRILQAQAATMTLGGLATLAASPAADANTVDAEVVAASAPAPKDKTPLPVEVAWQKSAEDAVGLIRIGDKAKTMAGWIVARKRKLAIGWSLWTGTPASVGAALIYSGSPVWGGLTLGATLWLSILFNKFSKQADVEFGVLKLDHSEQKLAEVVATWYSSLLEAMDKGKVYGGHDDKIEFSWVDVLERGVKDVDGKHYNLVQYMDIGPILKRAGKHAKHARVLRAIERHGRHWSEADMAAIRKLPTEWKQESVTEDRFVETVGWLAAHGNESVVYWVYNQAQHGVPKAQEAFEELIAADNPLAIRLLADAHGNGKVKLTPRKAENP